MAFDEAGNGRCKLEARGLARVVGQKVIVDGANLCIEPGEIMALFGPSGAGKSSILRLLNRLDEPTGGTVFLDGVDYRLLKPEELRRRVGFVSQIPALFPGTVADNVSYGPRSRGEAIDHQVGDVLARVGLAGFEMRDVKNLSGGEAQRIALARAVVNGPEVLLMDEPTSALDEAVKRDVERLIVDLVRDLGLTGIIVTHDAAQAGRLADRVARVEAGRVVRVGSAAEVIGNG